MDFSVRKIIFPHTFINKGVWRKKSKCVENGHYPVEKTRKIQEIYFPDKCVVVKINLYKISDIFF